MRLFHQIFIKYSFENNSDTINTIWAYVDEVASVYLKSRLRDDKFIVRHAYRVYWVNSLISYIIQMVQNWYTLFKYG